MIHKRLSWNQTNITPFFLCKNFFHRPTGKDAFSISSKETAKKPWILEVSILTFYWKKWQNLIVLGWVPPQSKVSPVLKLSDYTTYFTVGYWLMATLLLRPKSTFKADASVVAPLPWAKHRVSLQFMQHPVRLTHSVVRCVLTRHIDLNWDHPLICLIFWVHSNLIVEIFKVSP